MRILSLFFAVFIVNTTYSQQENYSFTIQPNSVSLLNADEKISILLSLNGFLAALDKPEYPNAYIDTNYLALNPQPFYWFYNVKNNKANVDSINSTTLLAVLPLVESQQYLIKLTCFSINLSKEFIHQATYTLIAKKNRNQFFFTNSLDYNTRNWNRKRIGTINYTFPNKLDLRAAKKMDAFNKRLAVKFSIPAFNVNYFMCYNPEQLFDIMGFDFIPNMYFSTSGGIAEQWHSALFAGNNSAWYPHEIVHFYTSKAFPNYNRIIDEGYATYLGGSGGKSLEELKTLVKEYIEQNPNADIVKEFVDFQRLKGGIPFTYIISALICRDIEKDFGFKKIKELFKAGGGSEEYFLQLEKVKGVTRNQFPEYVRVLIN